MSMMDRLAVIGFPIEHSVSPAMHTAAIELLGLDLRYDRVAVPPQDLESFVSGLRRGGWRGVNVTVPHKEAVAGLVDRLSPESRAIGAVNTVVVDAGGRLAGHNTDAAGFIRALMEAAGFDPAGAGVTLLGAGGAARAVLWALGNAGARQVRLFNRDPERAERLAAESGAWGLQTAVLVAPWNEPELSRSLDQADLLVNATSAGMASNESLLPGEMLRPNSLVVDLVYNPRPTRLLREASARGCRVLDGLPMLVHQGAAAFQLWTGRPAPVSTMMAAAERALGA